MVGRDARPASGARIHGDVEVSGGTEGHAAHRTPARTRRHRRSALGTCERERGRFSESHAALAIGRFLGHDASARRALVKLDEYLLPPGRSLPLSPRRSVDLTDALEIFEDLCQVSSSGFRRASCDGTDPGVDRTSGAVRASRPSGERRSAVLTVIEFERRQLAALPAEDPRHGAELGHDLVHVRVASADDAEVLCALRHRHLTSQRAAVHRGFRA